MYEYNVMYQAGGVTEIKIMLALGPMLIYVAIVYIASTYLSTYGTVMVKTWSTVKCGPVHFLSSTGP